MTPAPDPNPWYIFENVFDFNHDGLEDHVWAAPDWSVKDGKNAWDVYVQLASADGTVHAPEAINTYVAITETENVEERVSGGTVTTELLDNIGIGGCLDLHDGASRSEGWDGIVLNLSVIRNLDQQIWDRIDFMSPTKINGKAVPARHPAEAFYTGTAADEKRFGPGAQDAWIIRFAPPEKTTP